jgi:hypothetical protein
MFICFPLVCLAKKLFTMFKSQGIKAFLCGILYKEISCQNHCFSKNSTCNNELAFGYLLKAWQGK